MGYFEGDISERTNNCPDIDTHINNWTVAKRIILNENWSNLSIHYVNNLELAKTIQNKHNKSRSFLENFNYFPQNEQKLPIPDGSVLFFFRFFNNHCLYNTIQ